MSGVVTDGPGSDTAVVAEERPARSRRWFVYTLPGAWSALVFACLSFTPSLLPRSSLVQGVVCGITAAVGYGVGVVLAWVWRAFADRDPRPARRGAWRVFLVAAVVALLAAVVLGQHWQSEQRDLMGVDAPNPLSLLALPVVAALFFVVLVGAGHGLRAAYLWITRQLNRWIGPRAARAVGWIVVAGTTVALTTGVLADGLVSLANDTFSIRNTITPDGVVQPTVPTRSGGPGSLVSWDSLGREGRVFAGGGSSAAEIAAFTGRPAKEPIRAYAGLESADTTEQRAELAVDDLVRAGGFGRANLVVTTTTGSGFVEPAAATAIEYLTGGDSAIVAIQYSFLPSWMSYLVDQAVAREAGRDLFDAVYRRWSALPAGQRPRLFAYGESLGSFGGETAFSGEYDLSNRTSGAVFAGPPNFNTLYREFVDGRDRGSREVAPVYRNGRIVRFEEDPGTPVQPESQPWPSPRVLYLQHPSDPIVWWSPDLLFSRPDWLSEPRGRDVLGSMVWLPVVTFWQVSADLPMAGGVPSGHGHKYNVEHVGAWDAILQPSGWTAADLDRLRALVR
ncbi:MAG TPA: alpha/beta-hydrolase family protein [Mycobacteriales bacterium]|nr:alpha/beta-hydrolase family protein [Mycobacteriales bacterium]